MSYQRVVIPEYGGPEKLALVTEPTLPEPGADEVRIKVKATSAAFTDTLIRRGLYPATRKKARPFSPGYDMAGVVDKLGDGVTDFREGDLVADLTVTGGYSEYICLASERLTQVPKGADPAQATAMVLSYVTAYQMLHRLAGVKRGQTVLIHAAGGAVGTALMQLGQLYALKMFATASKSKHDIIEAYGAVPIDYKTEDFRQVMRKAGCSRVDAVFDCTTPRNFNRGFSLLNPGGTLVFYGMQLRGVSGLEKMLIPFSLLRYFARSFLSRKRSGKFYSIADLRDKHPDWFREDLGTLMQLLADGKLNPIIEERLTLADAQDAHRRIEAGSVKGKLVIVLD